MGWEGSGGFLEVLFGGMDVREIKGMNLFAMDGYLTSGE